MNETISDDDEIQFVLHNHPDKMICQMCDKDLTPLTILQREFHYDEHLSCMQASGSNISGGAVEKQKYNAKPKPLSRSSAKPSSKSGFKPPSAYLRKPTPEEQNVFWHSSQESEPPQNFSPGLIVVLKKSLIRSHERGATERAWLAIEQAVHIYAEFWDRSWGCGYRNYLMACAGLMDQSRQPMYFPLLDAPVPPGVRNLQILLERAWRDGYDEEGAAQLDRKIVNTTKYIGTADLYVAFTYHGIPAQLVDFELARVGVEPLLQWILTYFSGDLQPKTTTVGEALRRARPVVVTDKLPIILQHHGHSRTIVGCEQVKGGALNLLTFDPGRRIPISIRRAGLQYHNPSRQQDAGPSKPAKLFHQAMHPVETIKLRKRKSPDLQAGSSKRQRPSNGTEDKEPDVIVITDDEGDAPRVHRPPEEPQPGRAASDALNPNEVLKVFRIDTKSLSSKKKYQILWFPLEPPLSEQEKYRRRVVTSEKIP